MGAGGVGAAEDAGGLVGARDAGTDAAASSCWAITSVIALGPGPYPVPCGYTLQSLPGGQRFDPGKVNVTFILPFGGLAQRLVYVVEADCARTGSGWYFDNVSTPTKIFICPSRCGGPEFAIATLGVGIEVSFGCPTAFAVVR